jgi:hypothetical protein
VVISVWPLSGPPKSMGLGARHISRNSPATRSGLRPFTCAVATLAVAIRNFRNTSILLKNSDPQRKSRFRAPQVISADSPYGRAYESGGRGKTGRSAEPPERFFIVAASGLLNCDRRGKSSFSTSGNGRELFLTGRYDRPLHWKRRPDMDYFAGLDISMDETHICVLDREGAVVHQRKTASTQRRLRSSSRKRRPVVGLYSRPGGWRRSCFTG